MAVNSIVCPCRHSAADFAFNFVVHVPESPPVSSLVPLKTVGLPTQEYDMMSTEVLPLGEDGENRPRNGQSEVRWW